MTASSDEPQRGRARTSRVGAATLFLGRAERYLRRRLAWNRIYRAASYAKSALWIVPFISIIAVLAISPLLRVMDNWLGWRFTGLPASGAEALYQTVITLTLSFLVFTFGSLLVAIQIAGGQLTPRIIATTLLRDNVVRYSVGLFVFTLLFAVSALNRVETQMLDLVAFLVGALGVVCMAMFLFLIDYAARLLRPVSIAARVGNEGLVVIKAVYPELVGESSERESGWTTQFGPPARTVPYLGTSAIVLAVDLPTLVDEAKRVDGAIEVIPQVGDFLATEEPLFALYGNAAAIGSMALYATVAIGPERTLEQDPIFAFRILVDIALKALSAAINDPTTAVLAIDQVQRLLRVVGKRHLQREEILDDRGVVRVIYRTPNWEDYVNVSCNEIRNCGAGNVQVARRLRAMLDNLKLSLPKHRHRALDEERDRLDRMIGKLYSDPMDAALARIPDTQGLGGSPGSRATSAAR